MSMTQTPPASERWMPVPFLLEAVWETPYGDRRGMVRDRWGNVWQVATHLPERGAAWRQVED
jgi:hypothetical protein